MKTFDVLSLFAYLEYLLFIMDTFSFDTNNINSNFIKVKSRISGSRD